MGPFEKNTKKKTKKEASAAARRSSAREEKQVSTVPTNNLTSWRDEEELVDYEPEVPPSFSPIQDDISVREDRTPTHEEETGEISPHADELPALFAEDGPIMEGGKLSQFFPALPARQVLLKIPTSPRLTQTTTPLALTMMWGGQGNRRMREENVAADQMMLLWTAGASMLAAQSTGMERPAPGARVLVLAAPSTGSPSTG